MDTQLQFEGKTTDPWLIATNIISPDEQVNKFEDNFNAQFFAKLPDSDEYLALLEKKLRKIKNNTDVLAQLAEKREVCMQQLLSGEIQLEQDHSDFENSATSVLLKTIAPHKQALNQGELLQLVKNDQLDIADSNQHINLVIEPSEDNNIS